MRSLDSSRIPRARLLEVLRKIPFFARVLGEDPRQFQLLLDHARLLELAPGEVVIRRGEYDSWFFFVLQGHLRVGREEDGSGSLAVLVPGEVFGAIAVIRDSERSATIAAGLDERAILLGVDAAPFGELEEFDAVTLPTKLAFLETVNAVLRRRLLAYRLRFPDHELFKRLIPEVPPGEPGLERLRELAEQAEQLGELLLAWNEGLSPDEHARIAGEVEPEPDLVAGWDALMKSE